MTAPSSTDLSGWLTEQLAQTSPNLLRQMITTFVPALMGAEVDAVCGDGDAVHAEQHDEWTEGRRYVGLDVLTNSRRERAGTPRPAWLSPPEPT